MKLTLKVMLLIFFSASLSSCPENGTNSPSENNTFETIRIEFYEGGGMLPVSERFVISNDSAEWSYNRFKGETKIKWTPAVDDLNDIYSVLIENAYRTIRSKEKGEVYDRGGVSLEITVDGTVTKIDNSGSSFIEKEDQALYQAILDKLLGYVNSNIEQQKINHKLIISEDVRLYPYDIQVDWNSERVYESNVDSTVSEVILKSFPTNNRVELNFYYRDSVGYYGNQITYDYEDFFLDILDSNQVVQLKMEENQVIIE